MALVAYLTIAAVSIVALLEGATRLSGIAPPLEDRRNWVPDALVPFKQRPLSTRYSRPESGTPEIEYRHNSLGFRDAEHEQRKPPGVFRIVAVGDSFTYGVGAAFEDSYLARLERMLNGQQSGAPVEVIKLGMPRYFPAVEVMVLERYGLAFEPDLVLVGVLPNDVIDTSLGLDEVSVDESGFLVSRRARHLVRTGVALMSYSHVMRLVLARVLQPDSIPSHEIWKDNGAYESAWRVMESDLERMADMARRHGARFAVLSIPQRDMWGAGSVYSERRLSSWSAAHGAIFVSPLAALRSAHGQAQLYWEADGHCTAAGYEVIATALFDALGEVVPSSDGKTAQRRDGRQ